MRGLAQGHAVQGLWEHDGVKNLVLWGAERQGVRRGRWGSCSEPWRMREASPDREGKGGP